MQLESADRVDFFRRGEVHTEVVQPDPNARPATLPTDQSQFAFDYAGFQSADGREHTKDDDSDAAESLNSSNSNVLDGHLPSHTQVPP